jgi:hypothetical protein
MAEPTPTEIKCPRARSFMTPCIARDGHLALADDGECVGCGAKPRVLLSDLAKRHEPARIDLRLQSPQKLADALTSHVHAYVEGK